MAKTPDTILIAGGGPVGATAAHLLARAGLPVTVFEKEADVVIDYRASTIHPPTLDLLEECGATDAMIGMGLICPVWQFRDRERGKIAEFDLSLLAGDTRHPYRLQCEQFKLVGWLYDRLSEHAGASLLFGHEVTGVVQDEDGVTVTCRTPDGAVSDRYLQGCLNNLLPRDEPYEIEVRAIYRVSQRIADRYRKGRVFLAGDAAHINNPLGGMGLNGGLHDAIGLSERIAAVTHGRAAESELDGYQAQRKPEAVNAINAITERNKKLMEERDPEIRARNLDDWRALAADRERSYRYLLDTSMISSLRRSGMIA